MLNVFYNYYYFFFMLQQLQLNKSPDILQVFS